MKRLFILFIMSMLILSSCSLEGTHVSRYFDNDGTLANARMEQIFEALKNKDKVALNEMFSKTVNDTVDIDSNITDLFNFIQGDVVPYIDLKASGTNERRSDGYHWKQVQSVYDLETSEGTYHLAIVEIVNDTKQADKVGILSICIINAKDWEIDAIYRGTETSGIYIDRETITTIEEHRKRSVK